MKHLLTNFSIYLVINLIINMAMAFLVTAKKISTTSIVYSMVTIIQSFILLFFTISIVMAAKNSGWKA